jgi:homoserine kinase
MKKLLRITVPASSANLGPGFDVFAIALEEPHDTVEVEYKESEKTEIELIVEGKYSVSNTLSENVLTALLLKIMEEYDLKGNFKIKLQKNIPVAMGLGSSGASSVAAVLIAYNIFDLKLSEKEMIYLAGEGERIIAGSPHYDNVTASLLGGFVIVPSKDLEPIKIDLDSDLRLCVVMPKIGLPLKKTEFARKILPQNVSLKQMCENVSKASRIVYSLISKDYSQLKNAMKDEVIEIHRTKFIPGYEEVRNAAYQSGALGVCLSGAGPSILAITYKDGNPKLVLNSMIDTFNKIGIKAEGFITKVGKGSKVEYLI